MSATVQKTSNGLFNKERRGFFKKLFNKDTYLYGKDLVRPPYYKNKKDFMLCINCSAPCVTACENNIIERSYYNTPYINFDLGGCSFCDKCASVCERGVLQKGVLPPMIDALASIDRKLCLSWKEEACNSCLLTCSFKSILFFDGKNPYIDKNSCTGCGLCLGTCPSKAIAMIIS